MAEGEQRLLRQEEELEELRQTNSNLEDRVDRMSIQIASPNPQNQSLFDELDMSSGTDLSFPTKHLLRRNLKDGPKPFMVSDTLCPAVHILGA